MYISKSDSCLQGISLSDTVTMNINTMIRRSRAGGCISMHQSDWWVLVQAEYFPAKTTNQLAGSSEQQFNLKVPDGQMKASHSVFNNTAPVWYKNTLIYKSPHCANCHLNSEKSAPLLCYTFFIQSAKAVCRNHLDICRCFEAVHCLLRGSVHSRRSPRATRRPQLSESRSPRTRRELFGNR